MGREENGEGAPGSASRRTACCRFTKKQKIDGLPAKTLGTGLTAWLASIRRLLPEVVLATEANHH